MKLDICFDISPSRKASGKTWSTTTMARLAFAPTTAPLKSFAEMITKANSHPGCKLTSQNISSRGITIDMSCNTSKYQMNSHGVIDVLDSEHVRVTQTAKMVMQGHSNDTTTKYTGHFLSASCGNVKPGDPEIIDK